ncbi:MAG: sensor domain-containing diguanylate cyclase [Desulfurivibrio sp.]|nr:MAG: sensor domain-containing diguanylate cyclase [Desulfurivibrio sp.]
MKLNCRLKLIIAISLLVFVSQLTTAYIIIRQSKESLHEKTHIHGEDLAKNLAEFAGEAIISRNLASIYEQIRFAMRDKNIRHVVVVDPKRKVLVSDNLEEVDSSYPPEHIKKFYFNEKLDANPHYIDKNGETIAEITVPVTLADDLLGHVILGYSHTDIAQKISNLNNQTLITLLAGFAGAFLLTILLTSMITRPLVQLEKIALKISMGNFEIEKPDTDSNDEFNLLSQTMYSMAKRLEELVYNDPLTGLYNRQLLNIRLSEELARSRRHVRPLALLLVDIDHFKRINDSYGHLVGDEMLVAITSLIAKHIREVDCLARYGGEEFIILAPDMTENNARQQLAERIRSAVAKEEFNILPGKQNLRVTISVGLALYPTDAKNERELIAAADQALYAAKYSGRNQVRAYSELKDYLAAS